MFKNISSAIVNSAFENGVIKNENKEESIYGLNAFLTLTINVISALAIGLLFHMLPETVLFIFVYKSLRKYIPSLTLPKKERTENKLKKSRFYADFLSFFY